MNDQELIIITINDVYILDNLPNIKILQQYLNKNTLLESIILMIEIAINYFNK
jgi:hypothetical protein